MLEVLCFCVCVCVSERQYWCTMQVVKALKCGGVSGGSAPPTPAKKARKKKQAEVKARVRAVIRSEL